MSDDRMERVREKARKLEHAGYYVAETELIVKGAEMFRTLTDAEWEQAREDVDRAVWDGELPMADAAMRAVGLRKEGE